MRSGVVMVGAGRRCRSAARICSVKFALLKTARAGGGMVCLWGVRGVASELPIHSWLLSCSFIALITCFRWSGLWAVGVWALARNS